MEPKKIILTLKETFSRIVNDRSVVGSGRTTKMLEDVCDYILTVHHHHQFNIFVVGSTHSALKAMQKQLSSMLKKKNIKTAEHMQFSIRASHFQILFLCVSHLPYYKHYNRPKIFIDHAAEEEMIARSLNNIQNRLDFLRKGIYVAN
jgi:hypothetical protein